MSERVLPGPVQAGTCIKEAVCIHTKKIFDSCKAKDCIEDLRVYPTVESQGILEDAISVKVKCAELIYISIDVEPITFKRGCHTVDVRYYYKIILDAYACIGKPTEVTGLAIFDKRVILFGSDGNAKIFSSDTPHIGIDCPPSAVNSQPTAVVEAVDPVLLSVKLTDVCDFMPHPVPPEECPNAELPAYITACFDGELLFSPVRRRICVTLGQFSIIRLERDTQLLIPSYDYCLPEKDCAAQIAEEESPCEVFSKIDFPACEFFPTQTGSC